MEQLLTVRRWRRYGADRLFVTQETGARVGSVDLQSGEVVVDDPGLEDRLVQAAQEYLRADVAELVLPVQDTAGTLNPSEQAALEAWLGNDRDAMHPGGGRAERGSPLRARLERLAAEGWQVVHDVPLGRQGTLVAHLLLGPGGIFTVAEHKVPGRHVRLDGRLIEVDGQSVPFLRDARLEAQRTNALLVAAGCAAITVRSIVVIQGELEVTGRQDPLGPTLVVPRHVVPAVFRAMPATLEPARVAALANVARQRTTWAR
ncbi:NERD domain-containing protein [Cellulomonas edaphi]|uniref:NERD domain-containing protein n=1 Tax=Cellulomonas edaphi TaxID=3053468 RepID=A0ABT7S9K9_9CELL|nr:NERD domain-containing protein [Cellulomons edaphi]MDM7832310.1 NERD domain-containing protein [Cellulomons edaphi]